MTNEQSVGEHLRMSRRALGKTLLGAPVAALGSGAVPALAASCPTSSDPWRRYDRLEDAGLSPQGVEAMEQSIYELPTTSLMIVRKGAIAYSYGDIAQPSYLASARKSIMSMLYGKYVEAGVIDLDRTVGELGITENGPLLDIEKQARIRDLLTSSSGVYWPGGSPGGNEATPPRGSHQPGSYFHYNNWDFNVAGEVFQRLTGKSVFQALGEDLAIPLGFEDWDPTRQRMLGYASDPSRYKAYHLFLSARDMARLGQLMLNKGVWNGRRIMPARWIEESTATRFPNASPAEGIGYGYLWWLPGQGRTAPAWKGSFLANGHFGQFILCLPALDMVIVHRRAVPDELAIARNVGKTQANVPSVKVGPFLKIADAIVGAVSTGK